MRPKPRYSGVHTVCPRLSVSGGVDPNSAQGLVEGHPRAMGRCIMSSRISVKMDSNNKWGSEEGSPGERCCPQTAVASGPGESRASEAHRPHTYSSVTCVWAEHASRNVLCKASCLVGGSGLWLDKEIPLYLEFQRSWSYPPFIKITGIHRENSFHVRKGRRLQGHAFLDARRQGWTGRLAYHTE